MNKNSKSILPLSCEKKSGAGVVSDITNLAPHFQGIFGEKILLVEMTAKKIADHESQTATIEMLLIRS